MGSRGDYPRLDLVALRGDLDLELEDDELLLELADLVDERADVDLIRVQVVIGRDRC